MDELQINKDKAEEWVKSGAPNNALGYLGETVKSMSNFALENDVLHKSDDDEGVEGTTADETADEAEDTTKDADKQSEDDTKTEGSNDETTDAEEGTNDDVDKSANDEIAPGDVMAVLNKSITDTVSAAIAAYHEEVVVPLEKQLAALKSVGTASSVEEGANAASDEEETHGGDDAVATTKSLFAAFMSEDFLPSAAMTATIKEQYAKAASKDTDETVSDEEAANAAENVDKSLGNDEGSVPGHAFNDF